MALAGFLNSMTVLCAFLVSAGGREKSQEGVGSAAERASWFAARNAAYKESARCRRTFSHRVVYAKAVRQAVDNHAVVRVHWRQYHPALGRVGHEKLQLVFQGKQSAPRGRVGQHFVEERVPRVAFGRHLGFWAWLHSHRSLQLGTREARSVVQINLAA